MVKINQPIPDSKEQKKLTFFDTIKRQADLRIRLKYDGLNQSQFFRSMISGYQERDESLMDYLDRYKKKYVIQGKEKRQLNKKLASKGNALKKKFLLDKEDIENDNDHQGGGS